MSNRSVVSPIGQLPPQEIVSTRTLHLAKFDKSVYPRLGTFKGKRKCDLHSEKNSSMAGENPTMPWSYGNLTAEYVH